MAKFRFHKLAAIGVLIGFSAWIATGEFSSVGSAQSEDAAATPTAEQPAAPPRTVAVLTPPHVTHSRAIRVAGLTAADKRAVLATRSAGIIEKLPVKKGDHVREGDLIVQIDAAEHTAAIEMAKALLSQRQAEWEAAERLARSGNLPKLQLDSAASALATARSQLRTAEAALDRTFVRAPFAGIIDRVPVELGSSIAERGEVATLISLDPVIAQGEISERDLHFIATGAEADVRLISGETVTGTVRYISRDASPQTRTFPLEVAIPNADGRIPAGMTTEVTLRAAPADAVVLPRSVVTLNQAGDLGIRAVDAASKVVFYPIDLIDDTPNGLVLGGIPKDVRIIVQGQDLVTDGDTVDAREADPAVIRKLAGESAGTQ
jgi:multidrug efflux system membrane fusion protein